MLHHVGRRRIITAKVRSITYKTAAITLKDPMLATRSTTCFPSRRRPHAPVFDRCRHCKPRPELDLMLPDDGLSVPEGVSDSKLDARPWCVCTKREVRIFVSHQQYVSTLSTGTSVLSLGTPIDFLKTTSATTVAIDTSKRHESCLCFKSCD